MGKGHSKRNSDNLISHYSGIIEKQRRSYFKKVKIPEDEQKPGTWRTDLIESLTQRGFEEPESTWVPTVIEALFNWDMSLDMRWRENVKWFLSSPFVFTEEQNPIARSSMWAIPGIENKNIFQATSLTSFFEENLTHTDSHAVARLIEVFCDRFSLVYTAKVAEHPSLDLAEAMTGDITNFSEAVTDALKRYYSPINLLKLLKKPESYLTFVIRKRILQADRVSSLLLQGITKRNDSFEARYRDKLDIYRDARIADITTEVSPEIVEVADSPVGFSEAIRMVEGLTMMNSIQDKLGIIYKLTEATTLAIDTVRKGRKAITLTADDMVTLFSFFILRARVLDLYSHLELVESMVPFDQMESMVGFSLASLQASIQHIANGLREVPSS